MKRIGLAALVALTLVPHAEAGWLFGRNRGANPCCAAQFAPMQTTTCCTTQTPINTANLAYGNWNNAWTIQSAQCCLPCQQQTTWTNPGGANTLSPQPPAEAIPAPDRRLMPQPGTPRNANGF